MALRQKRKPSFLKNKVFVTLVNPEILPFTLTFSLLCVLFIVLRMRGVEQTYSLNKMNHLIEKETTLNKELKAQRAKLLSSHRLREISEKFDLKDPGPEQIILIPE